MCEWEDTHESEYVDSEENLRREALPSTVLEGGYHVVCLSSAHARLASLQVKGSSSRLHIEAYWRNTVVTNVCPVLGFMWALPIQTLSLHLHGKQFTP